MKILLIDNGTTLISKLEKLIPGHEFVHSFEDIPEDTDSFYLIILSGGSRYTLVGNEDKFSKEIKLVRESVKPIIGICFGYEIITIAFGGKLKELSGEKKGIYEIDVLDKGISNRPINVYESHRWVIDELPEVFEVLAISSDGPEIIKHKELPIWGLQFHPENFVDETDGDEVFQNIFEKLK